MELIRQRSFVFTILWIGFLLAISFMEAPLKFQAPSLTLPVGLEIGYLVFHALNGVELVLATVIGTATFSSPSTRSVRWLTAVLILWLLAQTLLLYTKLDERTLAIINGTAVPEAPYHLIYIGMEVIKLFGLFWLAHLQINAFAKRRRQH